MPRMGSFQQINLQQGTVYSLELYWTEARKLFAGGEQFARQTLSEFQDKLHLTQEDLSVSKLTMDLFCLDTARGESDFIFKQSPLIE